MTDRGVNDWGEDHMSISNQQIVAYWVEHEIDLAVDWSEAHERCWRLSLIHI